MQDIKNRDFTSLISNKKKKIHYTQRNKIATYFVSKNQNTSLSFSEEELIIFYHLLRFGYFDKEIIDLIYTAVTRKSKTPNSWFYRLVGKVNHPISASSDARSGKRKIYYLNKGFSTWLLTMIMGIDKIRLLTTTTEYDRSVYSIVSNNLLGGKPQTVNIHDLETRRLVAKILNKLFFKNQDKSVYDLNIQVVFPISRVNLLMVPDAVVFVNDNPFFIEYDRATERQTILLSKIFGYAEEPAFENSSLFFVFENSRKDNTQVSKRLMNFLEYVNEVEVEGVTGHDMLKRKNISLFSQTTTNASDVIVEIIQEKMFSNHKDWCDCEAYDFSELQRIDYLVKEISEPLDDDKFQLSAVVETDSWELKEYPIVPMAYIKNDLIPHLTSLYEEFSIEYEHMIIVFPKEVLPEKIKLPFDDYFLIVYR